jgi:hypothetical protein
MEPVRLDDEAVAAFARDGVACLRSVLDPGEVAVAAAAIDVRQSATITRPPRAMRAQLPFRYRRLIPLADPVLGQAMNLTLFRASSPAAVGPDATARAPGAG